MRQGLKPSKDTSPTRQQPSLHGLREQATCLQPSWQYIEIRMGTRNVNKTKKRGGDIDKSR